MNVREALRPAAVRLQLAATAKDAIIEELLELIAATGAVSDRDAALRALREREAKMSTGIQHGVAIPHAKTDTVQTLVASVGLAPQGVDFDSMDGEPSRIFIMTLSPLTRMGPHIQFLSAVSQALEKPEIRASLLRARTPEEVIAILAD